MRGDNRVVVSGGKGQYLYTASRWDPCKVDRVLQDGDEVKLGGVTLVARLTPGHTRGCTTWTWRVEDGGKQYDVVVIGSPNVNPGYQLVNNQEYPEIAADFARTFAVLKGLPCDVFLGAHGHYYGLVERYALLKRGQANPFVNPNGYKDYVAQKERAFRKALATQQGKAEKEYSTQLAVSAGGAGCATHRPRHVGQTCVWPPRPSVRCGDRAANGPDGTGAQSPCLTHFSLNRACFMLLPPATK
jgi:hypothetical protein